ncbi:MAG: T9SS type A sorting domain-containing protein [Candidatus Helarchaeota archaeon]
MKKKGHYLYAATGAYDSLSFKVYDIQNPTFPILVDVLHLSACNNIEFSDTLAFACGESYFYVLNVSDPENVSIISSLSTQQTGKNLVVSYPYVYVANLNHSIQIIDISNPLMPQIISTIPTVDENYDIEIFNNGLLTSGGDFGGLRLYQLNDPINPVLVDSFDSPGYAQRFDKKNDFIYLADYYSLECVKYSNANIETFNPRHLLQNMIIKPSPAKEKIEIEYSIYRTGSIQISIYSAMGAAIKKIEHFCIQGNYQETISTKELESGIYFVVLKYNNQQISKKFLIIK